MGIRRVVGFVGVLALAGAAPAQEVPAEAVQQVLQRAGPALGAAFQPVAGKAGAFTAAAAKGLAACGDLEIGVSAGEGGLVTVTVWPRVGGKRLDCGQAGDRAALLGKLLQPDPRLAPYAWALDAEGRLQARHTLVWTGDASAAALERVVLAAPRVDAALKDLLPALGVEATAAPDGDLAARLREAAVDEQKRDEILRAVAGQLPEVTPSLTVGSSAFTELSMNAQGEGLGAFRFKVPDDAGERRLVWAFAYPPGTAKGWYIVPVKGDPQKFTGFQAGHKFEGTGLPEEDAVILQRSETALQPGGEYVIWFQFKVTDPVTMYAAVGCFPYAKSDRAGTASLAAALGLKLVR